MLEKIKNLGNLPLVVILVIVVIIAIVLSIFKAQKSEEANGDTYVSDTSNQDEIEGQEEQDPVVEEIIDEEVPEDEEGGTEPEENVDAKYFIRVNYGQNVVTIYTKDANGEYTVPYKAMVCSTGTATPTSGTYTMPSSGSKSPRGVWGMMIGNVWAQYYTRIKGSILFHSVPYTERNKWSLEYWEYDKLGTAASAGCVRLTVEDAKWIYNNCPAGTKVEFYTDSNPGPLGKPTAQKISEEEAVRGWDPTDPDGANPWKTYTQEEEEEPDAEDNNTNTNKKPSTTTKPTTPTAPSTPTEPEETPDEGNDSGDETTTPSEGDNTGNETTPPEEGETSGENQEGSGSTGEETTNPDGEGSTGEEPTNPGEEEVPNEGDNSSGDNAGDGSEQIGGEQAGSGENEETPSQENTTTDDNSNKNA